MDELLKYLTKIRKGFINIVIKIFQLIINFLNYVIKKLRYSKKFRRRFTVCFVGIVIAFLSCNYTFHYMDQKSTITYKKIEKLINDKEDFIIYYYNSDSSNQNNMKIKSYLNKLHIKYYQYNDRYVNKEEYNNLLKLLNIDKKLFGIPSIIYIKNGKMYGNLINIDGELVVKQFVDSYDLYTVKK